MALYTILFGLSIFMIALVMAIIKKMFFHWKEEHKIERMIVTTVDRPAISVMISRDKCVVRARRYAAGILVYDVISRGDVTEPDAPSPPPASPPLPPPHPAKVQINGVVK